MEQVNQAPLAQQKSNVSKQASIAAASKRSKPISKHEQREEVDNSIAPLLEAEQSVDGGAHRDEEGLAMDSPPVEKISQKHSVNQVFDI
jgi:hypothetical protein